MSRALQVSWRDWREQLWSNFVRLESGSDSDNFFGRVEQAVTGSNRLTTVYSTAQLTERTKGHIRSDDQELVLVAVQRSGYGFIDQDGRQARLDAGDFGLFDTSRPYRLYFERPFEQFVFRLPRQHFADRLPSLNSLTARRFSGADGPGRVATGFVAQLAVNAKSLKDEDLASFELPVADTICTAIQLSQEGVAATERQRLERIQGRLISELRDPSLDIALLATSEGVSLRTLQRLFQAEGTTPKRWIAERRLHAIAADLRSPALSSRSITDIALSWGFNDLSHFSRSFRASFGQSPSDWRKPRGA